VVVNGPPHRGRIRKVVSDNGMPEGSRTGAIPNVDALRPEGIAMRFGIVGLGRMGANLARHAIEQGHQVVGYNRSEAATKALGQEGLEPAWSIADLVSRLMAPRIVFLYVPHGGPTAQVVQELRPLLARGDIAVDGGNSHWEDSKRHHAYFAEAGIGFLDLGTSGGVSGARTGACFMVGGDRAAYDVVRPILTDLAIDEEGVVYAGPPGAGHFVKLIHNAIEFGMVQAIAEGVELLQRSELPLDLPALFNNWMHGSVIRSWLVELMENALRAHPDFSDLSTYVEDTEEVKWVLRWALERDIPTPVTTDAQQALMAYRDLSWPAAKAVALLRNQYGGHPVHVREEAMVRR
jgi:6-phosphogluconate dehydrogenase